MQKILMVLVEYGNPEIGNESLWNEILRNGNESLWNETLRNGNQSLWNESVQNEAVVMATQNETVWNGNKTLQY